MPIHKPNNKGIAVIIAVTVIALLVTMVMELNRRTGSAAESASVIRHRVTLEQMTSSGIHMAMALLVKDKKEAGDVDSLQEDWANVEFLGSVIDEMQFDEGTLEVKITDELSRIQINALVAFPEGQQFNEPQAIMWERFLGYLRPDDGLADDDTMPSAIINSTKDWLDAKDDDAITGVNGAESDYYEGLDPPYACKNGPFDTIDEFLRVKGVDGLVEGIGGLDQVVAYLTPHGMDESGGNKFTYPGKININTAELPVLAALLPIGEEQLAMDLISWREDKSETGYANDLKDPGWYKQAINATIDPELITTISDFFRIEATAVIHEVTLKTSTVVKRKKEKKTGKYICKVLYWKSE